MKPLLTAIRKQAAIDVSETLGLGSIGGLLGALAATPFALKTMKSGKSLSAIAKLLAGAGIGTGAALAGKGSGLLKMRGDVGPFRMR